MTAPRAGHRCPTVTGVLLALLLVVHATVASAAPLGPIALTVAPDVEPGTAINVRLKSGRRLTGFYRGTTLQDTAAYAARFERYTRSAGYVPLQRGESLHVQLFDGREWDARFAGYTGTGIVSAPGTADRADVTSLDAVQSLRLASGQPLDPSELGRAARAGILPNAEVLELEGFGHGLTKIELSEAERRIPLDEVQWVHSTTSDQAGAIGSIAVLGLLGVATVSLLIWGRPFGAF